jgi:hypothetical protein
MLLPHDVFARLSWKGTSSIIQLPLDAKPTN